MTAPVWTTSLSLSTARAYMGGHLPYLDGKLWAVGGLTSGSIEGYYARSNATACYDATSNTWTTKANLPVYLGGHCIVSTGGKLIVIGGVYDTVSSSTAGSFNSNSVYIYDPVANTWSTDGVYDYNTSTTVPLSSYGYILRGQAAYTDHGYYGNTELTANGPAFFVVAGFGGYSSIRTFLYESGKVWQSASFDSFTTHDDLICDISESNYLYYGGGVGDTQHKRVNMSPSGGGSPTGTTLAPLPVAATNQQSPTYICAGPFNWLVGGGSSDGAREALYMYDPYANVWTAKTSSGTPFAAAAAGYNPVNHRVYVAGGFGSGSISTARADMAYFEIPPISSGSISMNNTTVMSLFAEGSVSMTNSVGMSVAAVDEFVSGFFVGIKLEGTPQDPIPMPVVYPGATVYPADNLYPLAG